VLTLAQQEAERSHHSYIGTEHLLLGIMALGRGTGYEALVELGIEIGKMRETIASIIGRDERTVIQQIIPTSRVKKVIEISFEEARRMGHNFVDTGHLLMGLVIEGEGIAAHVLEDLGANATTVRATVRRLMSERPGEEASVIPQPPAEAGESNVQALARLLRHPQIANLLRGRGLIDVEGLGAKLEAPPENVVQLRGKLANVRHMHDDLRRRLEQAEQDWLRQLLE
jgi:ATP-dependent Clp protease ATP-binding subunit ClpA